MVNKTILCTFLCFLSGFASAADLPRPNNFGGEFHLSSTLGKSASLSNWKGKLVLLNFGFTSCPDVCPMVLSKLALVQKELDSKGEKIQVLFVTVDPERDTLKKMNDYLAFYHPAFVGMRNESEDMTKALMKKYGAALESTLGKEGSKEIFHSDYVYLIDQDGYVAGFYDVKASYKELLVKVKKLL
jgi:protein SCO1/2